MARLYSGSSPDVYALLANNTFEALIDPREVLTVHGLDEGALLAVTDWTGVLVWRLTPALMAFLSR